MNPMSSHCWFVIVVVVVVPIFLSFSIMIFISPSLYFTNDGILIVKNNESNDESNNNNNDDNGYLVHQFIQRFIDNINNFHYNYSSTSTLTWEDEILERIRNKHKIIGDEQQQQQQQREQHLLLTNVVILITGSTSGIGKELVKWTYTKGATIIAIGRSTMKLEQLNQELVEEMDEEVQQQQQQQTRFFPILADFMDLQSVSDAVDRIIERSTTTNIDDSFPNHIDYVICNAGIHLGLSTIWNPIQVTKQNYDLTFGVNYLSHFLLTEKLLQLHHGSSNTLLTSTSTIVQVTSSFHFAVDGSDLQIQQSKKKKKKKKNNNNNDGDTDDDTISYAPIASKPGGNFGFYVYRSQRSYANSKLAQILYTRYYNNKRQQSPINNHPNNITMTSACPAWVGTSIIQAKETSLSSRIFRSLAFSANGYGLSSILFAMFHHDDDDDDNNNNNNVVFNDDYYINTKLMVGGKLLDDMIHDKSRWTYRFIPIRDTIMILSSIIILQWQRVFTNIETTKSSIASYDIQLQSDLYNWSFNAVQQWL